MPIKYTNRKGVTYYLCKGLAKSGKPRYYFARKPQDEPVEQIPQGYKINENVNGLVYLAKDEPSLILQDEAAAVQKVLSKHRKSQNYRLGIRRDRIEIYELLGPDAEEILSVFRAEGINVSAAGIERLKDSHERRAKFEAVLRFILADAEQRTFRVERRYYSGCGGWKRLFAVTGPIGELARQIVPKLGEEEFFELW